MTATATRRVDVVDALDEIVKPESGQLAVIPVVPDHRDAGAIEYESWLWLGGRWVRDEP